MIQVTLWLRSSQKKWIKTEAKNQDITLSKVVRNLIDRYLIIENGRGN